VLDQLFADEDGIFKVVAAPGQEANKHVAAKAKFSAVGARAVSKNLCGLDAITHANERFLVDAGVLVGALELGERVDVSAHFAAEHARVVAFNADDDAFRVHLIDDAVAFAEDHGAGVARGNAFHAGADKRRFATDERHGLALHVGTHEGAVGVVVFEERNQAGSDRNKLLGRNVNVVNFIAMLQDEVTGLAAVDKFSGDAQAFVERDVGLGDDVLVLFPSGQIEAIGLVDDLAALELVVEFFDAVAFHDVAGLEFAVASVDDLDEVNDAAAFDTAIGRFDEAVIIDAREATERADEADVRAFRRFNRADAAIVRRVNVADFE